MHKSALDLISQQNKNKTDPNMELERGYEVQLFINSGITETNVIAKLTRHSPRTIRDIKKRLRERDDCEKGWFRKISKTVWER
jgi:hypothetical protein